MKKVLIGILLSVLGIVSWDAFHIARYCFWLSDQLLTVPYTPQKAKELFPILGQSFTYLDQGSTSKVFVSEEGDAVIKVFLDKTYTSNSRRYLPLLRELGAHRKALKMKVEHYRSCLDSYALLANETGMIYYHLEPTHHFNRTLILKDYDGKEISLNLDEDVYFIQKKAVVAGGYIEDCIFHNNLEKAQAAISNLLEFTLLLYRQGIIMVDLQFTSNFGFVDDAPIRIDIEHLAFKKSWKVEYQNHLKEQLQDFHSWIIKHCPSSIVLYFNSEVNRLGLDSHNVPAKRGA